MTEGAFLSIAIAAMSMLYMGLGKSKLVFILFGIWSVILAALSLSGFYEITDTIPPRIATIFFPSVVIVIVLYRVLKKAIISVSWLIAVHILRIPVEIGLHQLYLEGLLPEKMTYSGFNFDILSGISAIVILVLHLKGKLPPTVIRLWNYAALILLAIVVVTAVLSVPSAIQLLSFDQPNRAVLLFPYVLLPGVIVPAVVVSHLFLLRRNK